MIRLHIAMNQIKYQYHRTSHRSPIQSTITKRWHYALIAFILLAGTTFCPAQTTHSMNNNNPLLCNPDSGICEVPGTQPISSNSTEVKAVVKPIKIIYFTDPICSSCWGIEPQLRKLKLEYGAYIEVEYRMGGLLPDWNYNSGGISKPSDVAHHWDEVSVHYDMPIDGDIWLEDPLDSSYPPSIAFKAAQLMDEDKAIFFLRKIREMVFLQKKNITKWDNLELAAINTGFDPLQLKALYEGIAKKSFEEDLRLGKEMGVRGFPTIFFTDASGRQQMVYGAKPFHVFENALLTLLPTATKSNYDTSWQFLFSKFNSLTAKEFSVLTNIPRSESEQQLDELTTKGLLSKYSTKNGALWTMVEPKIPH